MQRIIKLNLIIWTLLFLLPTLIGCGNTFIRGDVIKDIDWHINAAFEAQDACQQIDTKDAESVLDALVMVVEVMESVAANKDALQEEYNSMSAEDQQQAVWRCRQIKWNIPRETKRKLANEGTLARYPKIIEKFNLLNMRMQSVGQAANFAPFNGRR